LIIDYLLVGLLQTDTQLRTEDDRA